MIDTLRLSSAVPPEGDPFAPIVVVGSAPCQQDVYQRRPFAGKDGKILDRWIYEVGLRRSDLYLINLYPFKPKGPTIDSVPTEELIEWISNLHESLAKLSGVKVIVPLGNYATFALTGKGKIRAAVRNAFSLGEASASEAEKKADISKLRGSLYEYRDLNGRSLKVIPILHPEQVLFNAKWEKRTIRDWERVTKELYDPAPTINRRHIVDPGEWQVADFTRLVESYPREIDLAVDIETWGNQLSCVGFAATPNESITIPTIGPDRDVFLPYVKRLCESQAAKVLCNGLYDWYWLAWYGIWLNNFQYDVQLMHHAIDPAENHSLDFLASIYCPQYQYWKDEAKDAEEIIKYSSNKEGIWVYNGLDCCYTRELRDLIGGHLQQERMTEFYFKHYQRMLEPLCRTMLHGFRVDKDAQKKWAKKLRTEMKEIHADLNKAAGVELFAVKERTELREPTRDEWKSLLTLEYFKESNGDEELNEDQALGVINKLVEGFGPPKAKFIDRAGRSALIEQGLTYCISGQKAGKIQYKVSVPQKDFSGVKLQEFFYGTLGLPKQTKFKKGKDGKRGRSVSLDEGAIRKLTAKYPDRIGNYGNLLLAYREKKKELDYLKGAWDKDGRIRCSYKMITEAGRLASAKNPRRTGYNLQNLKR